jgi:hypothetical protein
VDIGDAVKKAIKDEDGVEHEENPENLASALKVFEKGIDER